MRIGYKGFAVTRWEYNEPDYERLIAIRLKVDHVLEPTLQKNKYVDDLFLLSIDWMFKLSSKERLIVAYDIQVDYFISLENDVDDDSIQQLITHSLSMATSEFNKRKVNSVFSNYNLKLFSDLTELGEFLRNKLAAVLK